MLLLSVLLIAGCNQQPERDRAKLDSILTSTNIDVIEFVSPRMTNTVTGEEARKLVTSLNMTNRTAHTYSSKQEVQRVRLLSGTNEICSLSLGEDGSWEFGAYGFRTRQ